MNRKELRETIQLIDTFEAEIRRIHPEQLGPQEWREVQELMQRHCAASRNLAKALRTAMRSNRNMRKQMKEIEAWLAKLSGTLSSGSG